MIIALDKLSQNRSLVNLTAVSTPTLFFSRLYRSRANLDPSVYGIYDLWPQFASSRSGLGRTFKKRRGNETHEANSMRDHGNRRTRALHSGLQGQLCTG